MFKFSQIIFFWRTTFDIKYQARQSPLKSCSPQQNSMAIPLARYLLKPVTGQRHQLRVHMNALGLPLFNDLFYPKVLRAADEADDLNSPLQLLAKTIAFADPVTGQTRSFESARQLNALP